MCSPSQPSPTLHAMQYSFKSLCEVGWGWGDLRCQAGRCVTAVTRPLRPGTEPFRFKRQEGIVCPESPSFSGQRCCLPCCSIVPPQASPTPGWLDLWPLSPAGELTSRCAGSRAPSAPQTRLPLAQPSAGVLSWGFVEGFCAVLFRLPSPPPGLPARLLLTSSTKSIARRGRTRSPPSSPRAAPRFSSRDNGGSLWPNQPPEGPRGRERFPPRPSVEMKAGLDRGLGPHHSKAPPGIRPFKALFGVWLLYF